MPITNPHLITGTLASSGGTLTAGSQIQLDTTNFNSNLMSSVADVQALADAVDDLNLGSGGTPLAASQVSVDADAAGLPSSADNAQEAFRDLQSQVNSIVIPGIPSFRPFRIFNGGTLVSNINFRIEEIVLDGTNFAEWNDINSIYAAGRVDKIVDIRLPTDAEIATSGESYPVAIEVTHLGGTARLTDRNLVRFFVKDSDTATNIETVALGDRKNTAIQQGDVIVLVKNASGQDWIESRRSEDPSQTLLPDGVFDINNDITIQNIANIETELSGVAITSGEAFIVETGGERFGVTIRNGDVIVSKVDSPDLTDASDDWLIVRQTRNAAGNIDDRAFLNQITRTGTRFDASRNVFVDPANVAAFRSMASGVPETLLYFDANGDGTQKSITFTNRDLQFTDLVGGTLRLGISAQISSFSGFLPVLNTLTFDYGSEQFTFDISNLDPQGGAMNVDITIPNQDYSAILNSDCSIILTYFYSGANFVGALTVNGLVNMLDGTLREPVKMIADASAQEASLGVQRQINALASDIDNDGAALQAIQPRISPLQNIDVRSPDVNALFLDSTGSDGFPSALTSFNQVSPSNPRFTGGNVALYVAVIGGNRNILKNITTSSEVALDDGEPNVSLGESLSDTRGTFFVYRVTGLTSGHVYEVDVVTTEEVVKWANDISNLQDDVQRIDAELEHAVFDIPEDVVHVLANDTSVNVEDNVTIVASDFNKSLGGTNAQTVFFEQSPNTPSGGVLNSDAINKQSGDRARRKLLYLDAGQTYANQASFVTAFDGSTGRDLISYLNGVFSANVFVPAIPAGSVTDTIYPAPSNKVSGQGIWQTIETLTYVNGVPVPEADEEFFRRNIPLQATDLTILYRGHANGNPFGQNTITLANVGGSQEVATTFTLSTGGETITAEVRYYPSTREIRVSENSRVNAGLPTINDIQVILSYQETRTVPATPATTRQVPLENVHDGGQVFAFKPSDTGNLIIVGDQTEIDTGFAYTTLFGGSEAGHITVASTQAIFYDFEDFNPTDNTVTSLENHASLPGRGLFVSNHTSATDLVFDVAVQAPSAILVAPNATRWRVTVDNSGTLSTTEIV